MIDERKLRPAKPFCPIDQQMKVLIVDDIFSDYQQILAALIVSSAHLISQVDYIDTYTEAKTLSEKKLDYDVIISDTQIGFNFSAEGEDFLGYNLLPYFLRQGIDGILMSNVDFSNEAEKINVPFFQKSYKPESLGQLIEEIHKRRFQER